METVFTSIIYRLWNAGGETGRSLVVHELPKVDKLCSTATPGKCGPSQLFQYLWFRHRWCITALTTDSWSRSSLRLSAAEQLSQAMLAYSRHGRSIVLYSRDIVSTLTRAWYPSFFRAAAVGAALFNMPDTWSDHFSVEARVNPRWETVHTCWSLSPPRTRFLSVSQPCLPTTICWLLAELKVPVQRPGLDSIDILLQVAAWMSGGGAAGRIDQCIVGKQCAGVLFHRDWEIWHVNDEQEWGQAQTLVALR